LSAVVSAAHLTVGGRHGGFYQGHRTDRLRANREYNLEVLGDIDEAGIEQMFGNEYAYDVSMSVMESFGELNLPLNALVNWVIVRISTIAGTSTNSLSSK